MAQTVKGRWHDFKYVVTCAAPRRNGKGQIMARRRWFQFSRITIFMAMLTVGGLLWLNQCWHNAGHKFPALIGDGSQTYVIVPSEERGWPFIIDFRPIEQDPASTHYHPRFLGMNKINKDMNIAVALLILIAIVITSEGFTRGYKIAKQKGGK
jgi:hypothetical protein